MSRGARVFLWVLLCGLLLCRLLVESVFAGEIPRIVLLTGADPVQPAALVQIQAIRATLETSFPDGVEVYLEALDGFRFEKNDVAAEYAALLTKKYLHQRIALIVALGNPAADFALTYRASIWPKTPILLSSVPEDWLDMHPEAQQVARVPYRIDPKATLSIAAALQPQARRLVVIGGVTDVDRRLTGLVTNAVRQAPSRWDSVESWEGMPIPELKMRLAALDLTTVVIYTTMYRDRDGRRYFPYEALAPMVRASAVPIYGWYSVYLQFGLTGGGVYDLEENGRRTGQAAASIIHGHLSAVSQLSPIQARCTINVSQAERLKLDTNSLPAECRRVNPPHSIYREYRGTVLLLGGVMAAQFLTIAALLAQRRQRRRAEAEATARGVELARAARIATVGELSASIAHEVGQPLGAILSNADAADLIVRSTTVDVAELQEILSDMRRDALRANDVVKRLRVLLQKHSVDFQDVALDVALENALVLIRPEARRRTIRVETELESGSLAIRGDEVQLQQVILNLAVNGMDAMQDTAAESRVLGITIRRASSGIELVVTDRGAGFDPVAARKLFEPFYTSKPQGMGLGLAIVRSVVDAHGGNIKAALRQGGGAAFTVWLPARNT